MFANHAQTCIAGFSQRRMEIRVDSVALEV